MDLVPFGLHLVQETVGVAGGHHGLQVAADVDGRRNVVVAEVGQSVFLEERAHGFQRIVAEVGVLQRRDGGLGVGVGVKLILLHEEFDELHRFLGVLGVRTDGEHHVVAGGEDLLAGVIGGRHLGETKFDIGVDQQDLRDGVGAERDDRGLALGEVLRALLVGDAGVRSGVGEELGFLLD